MPVNNISNGERDRSRINAYRKIFWAVFYAFLLISAVKNSYSYFDADFGWHLRIGEEIIRNKAVPHFNTYNFPQENTRWVDHEWAANALIYLIYTQLGYAWVTVFFAVLLTATFYVIHRSLYAYGLGRKNDIFIAPLLLLGFYAWRGHCGVRVQEFSFIFSALLVLLLLRFEKTRNMLWLAPVPLLFLAWSNFHGGFPLGFAIIGAYAIARAAGYWLTFLKNGRTNKIEFAAMMKPLALPLILLIFSVAASLVTPYGTELYSFLASYRSTYYLKHIEEWLPFYYLPIEYYKMLYIALCTATVAIMAIEAGGVRGLSRKLKSLRPDVSSVWLFACSLPLLIVSLVSKRNFPYFFITSLPLLAGHAKSALASAEFFFRFTSGVIVWRKGFLVWIFFVPAMSLAIAGKALSVDYLQDPFYAYCGSYPCSGARFLKDRPDLQKLKIFNQYDWGGYLLWTVPEMKLFIDGRLPQVEYKGISMLEEHDKFFKEGKAEEKLAEHGIELALIATKQLKPNLNWFERVMLRAKPEDEEGDVNHLREYLDGAGKWKKLYHDELASIYIKK